MDDTNSLGALPVGLELAAGTVAGRVHRKLGRPNQDAVATRRTATAAILVVCDGCGSTPRSEVGAALGARLVLRALEVGLAGGAAPDAALFAAVTAEVVAHLRALAAAMASAADLTAVVHDHFMFTTLAAVVTADAVAIHAIGDGVIGLGAEHQVLGPFPDNQPPYLGQALLGRPPLGRTWLASPRSIARVLVATDGADALVATQVDELVGRDVVYRNPHALTRALTLLAEDEVEHDWDARRVVRRPARLADDTTIAVARWSAP